MTTHQRRFLTIVAAILAAGFVALAERAEDQGEDGSRFTVDVATRAAAQAIASADVHRAMRLLSSLGYGYALVPLVTAASAVVFRRDRGLALSIPGSMLGAPIVEGVTKWTVGRPRPNLRGLGFISGHVLAAVTVYGLMAYVLWLFVRNPALRWALMSACAVVAAMVGCSRVVLDAHWLTDVLGAMAAGGAYTGLVVLLLDRRLSLRPNRKPSGPAMGRSLTS